MILAARYDIVRPLAQGGFGKTFLACDRHLPGHPHCVIKQLHLAHETPRLLKIAQRLFDLEAETLYRLGTHSQIPTLLAHFKEEGSFYLVQEYVSGQLLQDALAEVAPVYTGSQVQIDPKRVEQTYTLLKDLLTVLAFVHQQKVIHRDVKPANIIRRDSDGKLVLIDFGAVKTAVTSLDAPQTVSIGSPGYIAPEQQAGRPCFASDLYAVGMVGLQALTGLMPQEVPVDSGFRLRSALEFVGDQTVLENANWEALVSFLERLTRYEPGDRFPNATLALENLPTQTRAIPLQHPITQTTFIPKPRQLQTSFSPTLPPVNIAAKPPVAPLSAADYRNRQALKNKVHRFWIQGVLDHSLHGQVLLTLGLEERAEALTLPWNISWQSDQNPAQPLEKGTRVFDVFQQLGEGRSLLILGEPGAGKTTTLLTLARDLLEHSELSSRIPAIFNLSSWTGGSIDQWLITELNSKYQIPKAIGKTWVEEQQLLLLLDGLDEVRLDRQNSCAAAINQFHQDYGPEMVVCCRIKDYEAMEQRLGFQSAVFVRSLTDQQIWQYLNQSNTGLTGLKSLLEQSRTRGAGEDSLLDLARSPLILNIMALTYQGISAADIPKPLPNTGQGQNYTHQLFSAYIDRMFQRRGLSAENPPYSKQQTIRWLHRLAYQLTSTSQTVFLIERMQPDWLTSRRSRWAFGALVWAMFLLVATAIGYQVIDPEELPLGLLICGILFGRMFGTYRIVPAETLKWSWQKASRALLIGLTVGPLVGWALKVGFVAIFGDRSCLLQYACFQQTSVLGLAFGTVLGVTYGVIRGLSGERIATITKPNQGIRQSAKNAILFAVVASITPLLTARILGNTSPAFWTAAGLSFGLALGGGEACVKHGILRLILFCQGHIPWNYVRFLDYAGDRIFLQKVGGGYIFIHRLLLEHFATSQNYLDRQ